MGEVAISLKVTPEGLDSDIGKISENIKDKFPVKDLKEEKIGFGLSALKVLIVRDEKEGGTDEIENYIAGIDGVTSVEVENVSLL